MRARFLLLLMVAGAACAPFVACSDGTSGAPDVDAEAGVDTWRPYVGEDAAKEEKDAGPVFNKDGWLRIDFDPHIDCTLYAAPSPDKMPPPIAWEPCDAIVASTGWSCKQVTFEWPPPYPKGSGPIEMIGATVRGWIDPLGHAWLALRRQIQSGLLFIVGEADGPVHQALAQEAASDCGLIDWSLSGRNTWTIFREQSNKIVRSGAIGGDVDKPPVVLESSDDGLPRAYIAGPNGYFVWHKNDIQPWSGGPASHLAIVDPGQTGAFNFVGDAFLFEVGNLDYHRIKIYTPAAGLQDLVSFGNDLQQGAADIGTDGTDMVWTEGYGHPASTAPWTKIDIVTAPYTTNAAQISKRRLRSEDNSIGTAPFSVGCGYAGHRFSSLTQGTGARLVRLSDGQSWRFTRLDSGAKIWQLLHVLAITCDEVFVLVNTNPGWQVVRIRLDSLGPGEAPD